MTDPAFNQSASPVRAWAVAKVESALLGATRPGLAEVARWPFAVQMGGELVALPGLDDPTLPGRRVTAGEAMRRGYALADVVIGADEPAGAQGGRHDSISRLGVFLTLPENRLYGGLREYAVAERVAADCYAAIMADPRLDGLAVTTDPDGGMGLYFEEPERGGEPLAMAARRFRVRLRHPFGSLSFPDLQGGDPPESPPVTVFTLRRDPVDGDATAASVTVSGKTLTLRETSPPEIVVGEYSLYGGKTIDALRAEIAGDGALIGWTVGSVLAHGDEPAEDVLIGVADAFTTEAGVTLR